MKVSMSFTFDQEVSEELREIAEEENINLSSLARELFDGWLNARAEAKYKKESSK